MNLSRRESLVAAGSLLAIAVSGSWSWWSRRSPLRVHRSLHQGVGERLAEETAERIATAGDLVLVTLESGTSDALDEQRRAFERTLRRWPRLRVAAVDQADASKSAKYGPGTGLSARRLRKLQEKHPRAAAIVSLLGAPNPEDLGPADSKATPPRLVAVCRSPRELAALFERGALAFALVPRFTFPAPGPENPRTPGEWFTNRYQVVTPDMARS